MLAHADVLARSNQGIVYRLVLDGRELAVKQAAGTGPLLAINRHALKREFLAYRRLEGVAGVPHCLGMVRGRLLVLEYVPARPFRDAAVEPVFFGRLFEFMRQTDLNAWVKLKYGGYSGVSEADRALLRRSWLERVLSRTRR